MPGPTVLIIDDETPIRRVVRSALKELNARVLEADTAARGIDLAGVERPELIVLDLGLPDMQGVEVCREIRRWSLAPILVLSGRHSDEEKVHLLDAGADDYVTKPFSISELLARVRALLRRAQAGGSPGEPRIEVGGLVLDVSARSLTADGAPVHLTPIEWELLREMMAHPGHTLTHQHLFAKVWRGRQFGNPQQYLRVYVGHLRRKIEPDALRPRYIHTQPGVGYRFATATELPPGKSPAPMAR